MAALFTMLMFSLAGIPPFAGFLGKLVVLQAAVSGELVWLAIVGAVSAVVAAAYYLRILASVWFTQPAQPMQPASAAVMATATIAAALSFPVLVLALGAVERWAEWAVGRSF